MTEKRSDYRKKLKRKKGKNILNTIRSAFDDDEEVDVNPDFTRDENEVIQSNETLSSRREGERHSKIAQKQSQSGASADKALKLKGKLNRAIVIVTLLIVLVLLALFHL